VIDMNDTGLLRMEADPERLAQEPVCQGEGRFGLLTRFADDGAPRRREEGVM